MNRAVAAGAPADEDYGLAAPTPGAWFEAAPAALELLLIDHANCEKKAASSALGLIFSYAEDTALGLALARLAREELRHFEQALRLLAAQGLPYRRLSPGRYAGELRRATASHEPARKLDLLITGALIEARSCERFRGLVPHLPARVAEFYASLEAAEGRHTHLYLDLARVHARRTGLGLGARFRSLAALEAELATRPDPQFRFHSGPPG
ncbi:MAG TPA: tRNA isopentenyl-2-thiomethyl-A-37 hydroxylase MiaE [Steroidobacteraceae bacterium]|nr:tRNA isopentenyl-2-thiomethyl-A-37 hydroxylase MiaE [Steroidobacteraceae bacterium]